MGNGGLCGGRGDIKTSENIPSTTLPNQAHTTTNSGDNLAEMAGINSSTLCCDLCNTKFGFLTRKVSNCL